MVASLGARSASVSVYGVTSAAVAAGSGALVDAQRARCRLLASDATWLVGSGGSLPRLLRAPSPAQACLVDQFWARGKDGRPILPQLDAAAAWASYIASYMQEQHQRTGGCAAS